MAKVVAVYQLGTVEYNAACQLQEEVAAARVGDAIGDTLLLLQHPPVITVGRWGGWEDVLASAALLRRKGVDLLPTDRAGRATYHGPGQLIAYSIFKLPDRDLHGYVWRLEETVIRVLEVYGLQAGRLVAQPGVWLAGNKIAAIGLAVRQGVTRHGVAINVAPRLDHFDLIVPCGLADQGVTSMARELGRAVDPEAVGRQYAATLGEVFDCQVAWTDPALLPPVPGVGPEHTSRSEVEKRPGSAGAG
ncbi:MAG TPA: lipoyl(octanoyl) transferase LipB [Anaerolineae bacterium]|nr:lipoyl(octanoyl) transferase LipB [Anaerolineae bacterium]